MASVITVSVTLSSGRVIKFDTRDGAQQGMSYSVDGAGVLTIESRQIGHMGRSVITYQRFSPAAWQCVEEAHAEEPHSETSCAMPAWLSGVVGAPVLSGQP